MRSLSFKIASSIALLMCSASALAQSGPWTVSEAKGDVVISDAQGSRVAKRGATIAEGGLIEAGAKSSAIIIRDREFVTIKANSRIRIADTTDERSVVQILQDWGSAIFNIGKQDNPHFAVETPYLAAVVKGTTFTITVTETGASMQVTEGAVEAQTIDGGARDLIMPGAVAIVTAGDRFRLTVEDGEHRVIDSPARQAGNVQASAVTNVRASSGSATRPAVAITSTIMSGDNSLSELSNGLVSGSSAIRPVLLSANSATDENGYRVTPGIQTRELERRSGDAANNGLAATSSPAPADVRPETAAPVVLEVPAAPEAPEIVVAPVAPEVIVEPEAPVIIADVVPEAPEVPVVPEPVVEPEAPAIIADVAPEVPEAPIVPEPIIEPEAPAAPEVVVEPEAPAIIADAVPEIPEVIIEPEASMVEDDLGNGNNGNAFGVTGNGNGNGNNGNAFGVTGNGNGNGNNGNGNGNGGSNLSDNLDSDLNAEDTEPEEGAQDQGYCVLGFCFDGDGSLDAEEVGQFTDALNAADAVHGDGQGDSDNYVAANDFLEGLIDDEEDLGDDEDDEGDDEGNGE